MEINETVTTPSTSVSIRIFEPDLLPEEITKNLGVEPDHLHLEGDFPRNDPKYSAYKHGMWLLKSKLPEAKSLEEHLESIVRLLERNQSYIQSVATHATVDFYCVLYGQNSFQLSPQILGRIANLGATFGVILYQ